MTITHITTTEQRLMGEAQVLRELLTESLSVIKTIGGEDDCERDLLANLCNRIECALNPSTEGALL